MDEARVCICEGIFGTHRMISLLTGESLPVWSLTTAGGNYAGAVWEMPGRGWRFLCNGFEAETVYPTRTAAARAAALYAAFNQR